jgi:penicillin-binding protein 1A
MPAWIQRLARLRELACALVARHPRVFAASLCLVAAPAWVASGWFLWLSFDVTRGLPDRQALAGLGDMVQATTLYDIKDRPVFTIFKEQRIEVPLERVSPNLVRAVLAIEDQRFYDHRGVDVIRIGAAVLANLGDRQLSQGGSTITQQLARQSFLTLDKTFRRKLRELVVAAQIERMFTKHQILEFYLNKVYFGDGFYGVEAAALGFLGKHAADLDVGDAALLAGLIKSPSTYAPTVRLDRAIVRRNLVLQAMVDMGAIDAAAHERYRTRPVTLRNALRRDEAFGLYFKEHVRRELVERFGWDRVYQGGLRVFTTIDPDMQQAAERAVERSVREIERRPGYRHPLRPEGDDTGEAEKGGENGEAKADYLQAALIAIDVPTGQVRAMVGGRSFAESRFNRAIQARRQPGSAFKPFVFATALEAGYTPASVIANLDDPVLTAQGAWTPEDEHTEATALTLRAALRMSSNRAAVQLIRAVGINRTVEYASRLSVGPLPAVPSIALGAGEVTLQSLTAAFAAFADGGLVRRPAFVRRHAGHRRDDGVHDGHHARRRDQRRHRLPGTPGRLHAARGGQDRYDQRLRRRLVRRVHPQAGHRGVGRVRPAQDHPPQRLRVRSRRPALGPVHEGGHAVRPARLAAPAALDHPGHDLPPHGRAAVGRLRSGGRAHEGRRVPDPLVRRDGILRGRHRAGP